MLIPKMTPDKLHLDGIQPGWTGYKADMFVVWLGVLCTEFS